MSDRVPLGPSKKEKEEDGATSSSSTTPILTKQLSLHSNKIFLNEGKEVTTYYLPAYFSVLFKKFGRFDFAYGTLEVSMTLVLRVKVELLNEEERDAVRSIKMRINEDEAITFDKETSELKELDGFFSFTMRTTRTIDFLPTITNYPFDIHDLKIKFELTSKSVNFKPPALADNPLVPGKGKEKEKAEKTRIFRFNCHHNPEYGIMHSFKMSKDPHDDVDRIPELNLAYGKISCQTPVEQKKKGSEEYFPVVQIKIPLFREPEYVLLTSAAPLLLLNILTVASFAIDPVDYVGRIGVLSVLMLSLFALLPSIRQKIPLPSLTSLDVYVFTTMIVILLAAIDSFTMTVSQRSGRIISPIIAVAIILCINGYFFLKYFSYLKSRKEMEFKPDLQKIHSAGFSPKSWDRPGAIFPDGSYDIAELRGPNYDKV